MDLYCSPTTKKTMTERHLKNRVKVLRLINQEMTQSQLGEKVGVTRQTIAAIESGKYSPSLECAMNIAETLKAPLEEVFFWSWNAK
jgi:putative transcriptional regulator